MYRAERLEILVEEPSMQVFLRGLLPRLLPEGFALDVNCFIRPHSGKSDLQRRLPATVSAYRNYPQEVILIVVQDQDASDCVQLKNKLVDLIRASNPALHFLVRIACRELENWYLGDLEAVEKVYPESRSSKLQKKAKFRDPDLLNGAEEMKNLSSRFSKTACAREIAPHLRIESNRSKSFWHFISGTQRILS